jgi:hypothetical protein
LPAEGSANRAGSAPITGLRPAAARSASNPFEPRFEDTLKVEGLLAEPPDRIVEALKAAEKRLRGRSIR